MSWAIFVWTVLPTGAVLTAMLASGQGLAMATASKVLSTPIRLGTLQLSLAVFMTALCGTLACLSYSGMCRHELRVEHIQNAAPLGQAIYLRDQQQRNYFLWGRNYYLTLLGLTLWLLAWRLKCLFDAQQLTTPKPSNRPVSNVARAFFVLVGVLAFLAADVPLCRINYNLQLAAFVSPRKAQLQHRVGVCEGAFLNTATGTCAEWCNEVKTLSAERLATIQWARKWHVLGRLAAQVFDEARGVEQGDGRIQELFNQKACSQVLKSVDKSNQLVNVSCIVFAGMAIIGAFVALSNAYEGSWLRAQPVAAHRD